jgi:hypothetical protein
VRKFHGWAKKVRLSDRGSREAVAVIGIVPITTLLPLDAIVPELPLPPLPHEIRERSTRLQATT